MNYRSLIYTFSLISLFSICTSCKTNDSSAEWQLSSNFRASLMMKIPPNGTLVICDYPQKDKNGKINTEFGDDLVEAIRTWGSVIGRSDFINISRSLNCGSSISNDKTFFLTIKEDPDKVPNDSLQLRLEDYDTQAIYYAYPRGLSQNSNFRSFRALVAAGALWGLCASEASYAIGRYSCNEDFTSSDGKHYKLTKFSPYSVMGGLRDTEGELTDEDIGAIISMISFNDTAKINLQWKEFFSRQYSSVAEVKTMFSPTCTARGQITILGNDTRKVYVSDACKEPANKAFYANSLVLGQSSEPVSCEPLNSNLIGGYLVTVTKNNEGFIARSCQKKGTQQSISWFKPLKK